MSITRERRPGRLRRLLGRLATDQEELDNSELRESSQGLGHRTIAELADREVATVSGTIRNTTLSPLGQVPALRAELYDGTQRLQLIWLGRRSIAGIHPGTYLRARGRVCTKDGIKTIYNPFYDILPNRGR